MQRYFRTFLPVLAVLLSGNFVSAQTATLGTINFFKPWTAYVRKGYAPTETAMQQLKTTSGSGVVWSAQFLASDFALGTDTLEIVPLPASYPYFPAYYDTSNLMMRIRDEFGSNYYAHFLQLQDSILYVGGNAFGVTGMIESVFQRFDQDLFPVELRNTIQLGYQRTYSYSAIWVDASGSDEHYILNAVQNTIADGEGDFITLQGDTLHDMLRIRSVISYTDSNQVFGVHPYTDTLFSWYSPEYTCPILTIRGGNYAMNYQYFGAFPLSYFEPDDAYLVSLASVPPAPEPEIHLYPNPAGNYVQIEVPDAGGGQVSLYDAAGRICLQQTISGTSITLATAHLAPGNYQLKLIRSGTPPVIHKLLIQR